MPPQQLPSSVEPLRVMVHMKPLPQLSSSVEPWRVMVHMNPLPQLPSYLAPMRVTLNVKLPMSKDRIPVEMAEKETVFKLKEKIVALEGMEDVTVDMIVLCPYLPRGGGWSPNMDVFLKWSGPVSQGSSRASGNQMVGLSWIGSYRASRKQMVGLSWIYDQENLTKKLIEVNPVDNVSWVLRNHMEQREGRLQILPPHCAYYFLYKQQVMNQQESFDWHGVRDGDTIRVFVGYATDTLPSLSFNIFYGFYYL